MKTEEKDTAIIIRKDSETFEEMIMQIDEQLPEFADKNIIVDLEETELRPSSLIPFERLANLQMNQKKSFVIVASIDFDEVDDAMIVVPTLQEAFDIIEMEEIERDLGF